MRVLAVSSLMAAVPSGSYAVLHHMANDLDPAMPAALRHWNKTAPRPIACVFVPASKR